MDADHSHKFNGEVRARAPVVLAVGRKFDHVIFLVLEQEQAERLTAGHVEMSTAVVIVATPANAVLLQSNVKPRPGLQRLLYL